MEIKGQPPIGFKKDSSLSDTNKEAKLQKACKDFEAILLKQMITAMRKSVPKGGLFEEGYADEMYQSMHDDELAKNMAHGKGTGIADILYDQLSGKTKSSPK